jgi:hypothetical protein
MKTGPGALDTAENESGSEKHEIGTRYPQNMKTGPDALDTANGSRHPQYRRKRVQERKT